MIKIIKSTSELELIRKKLIGSIGLIPTMGNLHAGHLSLIIESIKENDITFISIFVNPKQFGPNEDFKKYPRTFEKDFAKISAIETSKDIYIYAPKSSTEVFPQGFSSTISVQELGEFLCGGSRPGHFDGVTTVVYQLFSLINPTLAYFGQKDYQQFKIIERMTKDLRLNLELRMLPIIREEDGLALSSRNQYLDKEEERPDAIELFETISHVRELLEGESFFDMDIHLMTYITMKLDDERWDYLEVLDADNLKPIEETTTHAVIAGALKIGRTRLIDNTIVELKNA